MKKLRAILLEAVSTGVQASDHKQSLPEQDARLNEVSARDHWDIIDLIVIPGFSRVFYTYREFAEAALAEGISAPMRMFEHWARRDFDVFAVSTGDRFGREQSIFAEVVSRTIDVGARVFTLRDGYIDRSNYRMFVSMAGYSASSEVDELKRRRRFGMGKRARRGLPLSAYGHIPSHTVVGQGDAAQTIVNEDKRRLFADVAELLLACVPWRKMPERLAERGHFRPDGRLLSYTTLRLWLMHPTAWGNTAQHFQDGKNHSVGRGFWVFDPNEPAPEYVTIHYGTHPPIYEGALAERVKAELRRRFNTERAKPLPKRKFTGLVVCNVCHYSANYHQVGTYLAVHCSSRHTSELDDSCTNYKRVNEKRLIAAADTVLRELVEHDDWSVLYGEVEPDDSGDRLAAVDAELLAVKDSAKRLYDERANVPSLFRDQFNQSMNDLTVRGEALEAERARLKLRIDQSAPDPSQIEALADYRQLPLGALWEKPNGEIHQWLSRIFGKWRFVIDGGEVIGMSRQPHRHRFHPRKTR